MSTPGTTITSYSSERRFQLWSYTVSHKTLLLRSTKTAITPSGDTTQLEMQVDLVFLNVAHVNLPSRLMGVAVRVADEEESAATLLSSGAEPEEGQRVYLVDTESKAGYVVAGGCVHMEDESDYWDRNPMLLGL